MCIMSMRRWVAFRAATWAPASAVSIQSNVQLVCNLKWVSHGNNGKNQKKTMGKWRFTKWVYACMYTMYMWDVARNKLLQALNFYCQNMVCIKTVGCIETSSKRGYKWLPSAKRSHSYGKPLSLIGESCLPGPFSMAMLVITRGYTLDGCEILHQLVGSDAWFDPIV